MKLIILVGLCSGLCSVAGDDWLGEGYLGDSPNSPGPAIVKGFNLREQEVKESDDYLEYLGYNGDHGTCDNRYNKDEFTRNRSRSHGYRDGANMIQNDYYDDEFKKRCDRLFGFNGPTANDEPENIIRPCALDDWQCIRKYFAANSKCKPASGPIPDPLYLDVNTVFLSVADIVVTAPNLMVRGLSTAKIREFYVNKKSGNLVFAINLTELNETIPRIYFRYRRNAKESIVLAGYATVKYSDVTFTAVIPKNPHLQLQLAEIHTFVGSAFPPFFLSPSLLTSTDPEVLSSLEKFNQNIPVVVREVLIFQASIYTSIYIQSNICDFGLQIVNI